MRLSCGQSIKWKKKSGFIGEKLYLAVGVFVFCAVGDEELMLLLQDECDDEWITVPCGFIQRCIYCRTVGH